MELIECQTCGASSFTNGKCDYCRNQYEVNEDKIFYGNSTEDDSPLDEETTFKDTKTGKLIIKIKMCIRDSSYACLVVPRYCAIA